MLSGVLGSTCFEENVLSPIPRRGDRGVIALHGIRDLRSRFYAAGQDRNPPRAKVWIVSLLGKRRHQYRLDAVREKLLFSP